MFPPPHIHQAFLRVKENRGCAGSDGVSIREFEDGLIDNLEELRDALQSGRYAPFPLLRFPVPKRSGQGERYLSVPTVRDRVAQTAVMMLTYPIFEAEFEHCSWAYRPGRSWQKALVEVKKLRDQGYHWVVDADIDAFFDNVDHQLMMQRLQTLFQQHPQIKDASGKICVAAEEILSLFELWIRAEVYDGQRIWQLNKGIAQGSVVSPSLANLFLDKLDEEMQSLGIQIVRFADDFLLLAKSQQAAQEALELTDLVLEDLKLELDEADVIHFKHGFKFLGAYLSQTSILVPLQKQKQPPTDIKIPPPLNLKRYLELKRRG